RHPSLSTDLPAASRRPRQAAHCIRRTGGTKKKPARDELVLLSQDEARFPLVPTLVRTLGCKALRPVVGGWDIKDMVYAFASVNCLTGKLVRRVVASRTAARRRTPHGKTRRMQQHFARHLLDVGRVYPQAFFPHGVLTIDGAPWHCGPRIQK